MQKMKNIELVSSKQAATGLYKTLDRSFILKNFIKIANSDTAIYS